MSDIKVSAIYYRLFLLKRKNVIKEILLPNLSVLKTGKLSLGVGNVNGYEIKLLKLKGDNASLGVMLGNSDAIGYGNGLLFCKYRSSAVALLFCIVPVLMVSGKV